MCNVQRFNDFVYIKKPQQKAHLQDIYSKKIISEDELSLKGLL